ncbi:hypothetical protein IHE44_0001185 [Lamprotornis superbus]|uniref:Uncharacterized protein n=1 Tax=Lamprotornis superbus TaxID=245042 RepID=A0A835P0S2_9PASS|nr:hypothetical protein IHE44_0001185 [Lamprotornis superbus]
MGCGGSRADAIEPRYYESWTRETESTWLTNTDSESPPQEGSAEGPGREQGGPRPGLLEDGKLAHASVSTASATAGMLNADKNNCGSQCANPIAHGIGTTTQRQNGFRTTESKWDTQKTSTQEVTINASDKVTEEKQRIVPINEENCSDDVLTSCVRRLGSHPRRKPMNCMAHEAALAHASSHQGGSSRIDGLQEMALVHNYLGNSTGLAHADPIPLQGGSCRVVDAACPGLLIPMLVLVEEASPKNHLDIFTPGGLLRNEESYLQGLFFEHYFSNINGSKTSNKIIMLKDMDFQIKDLSCCGSWTVWSYERRMLTHNWFISCGKGRMISKECLSDVPKKKKDLGTQGSHSPAVRCVTAHGNPTNRMLQNLGLDSTWQVEPLLVQESSLLLICLHAVFSYKDILINVCSVLWTVSLYVGFIPHTRTVSATQIFFLLEICLSKSRTRASHHAQEYLHGRRYGHLYHSGAVWVPLRTKIMMMIRLLLARKAEKFPLNPMCVFVSEGLYDPGADVEHTQLYVRESKKENEGTSSEKRKYINRVIEERLPVLCLFLSSNKNMRVFREGKECYVSVCLTVLPELRATLQLHQGLIKNFPRRTSAESWSMEQLAWLNNSLVETLDGSVPAAGVGVVEGHFTHPRAAPLEESSSLSTKVTTMLLLHLNSHFPLFSPQRPFPQQIFLITSLSFIKFNF